MRRVGGKLTERWIDRDPIVEQDFRPRVVKKLAVDVGQAGGDARGKSRRHVQERRITGCARYNRPCAIWSTCKRVRHAERDLLRQIESCTQLLIRSATMRGSRSVPAICRASEMIRGWRLWSSGSGRVFCGSRPVIGSVNVVFSARSGSLVDRRACRPTDAGAGRSDRTRRGRRR